MYAQRYKDTAQLNAKSEYYQMNANRRGNGIIETNSQPQYGRTDSYGLALKSEATDHGAGSQQNPQSNHPEPRRSHSSMAMVRPNSQAHPSKCDGSKAVFLIFILFFWCSGIGLLVFSSLQMLDHVHPELWSLIQVQLDSSLLAAPILHYLAISVLVVGFCICLISCGGCWAGLQNVKGGVCLVIILLVLLMLGEVTVAVLAILIKSLAETDLERDLVVRLREEYNMPGAELFTRAVDLAQTNFYCCGVAGPEDYSATAWQRELGDADSSLKVPLTCCFLNSSDGRDAFLNPVPKNLAKCQDLDSFAEGWRFSEGCGAFLLKFAGCECLVLVGLCLGSSLVGLVGLFVSCYFFKQMKTINVFINKC